jgi:hypothetical protein
LGEKPVEDIEKYLDELDLDRLEQDRILDDMFPEANDSQPPIRVTHRDDDPVQAWLARERQSNAKSDDE